jgi:hypothetical protein
MVDQNHAQAPRHKRQPPRCYVIMATANVIDRLTTARGHFAFKADKLMLKARMFGEGNRLAVQQRQEGKKKFGLR